MCLFLYSVSQRFYTFKYYLINLLFLIALVYAVVNKPICGSLWLDTKWLKEICV